MATIKSYTDIEQSRKLAEILPLESADMCWYLATKGNSKAMFNEGYNEYGDFELPCWSLAALLGVLDYPQLSKDKLGSGKEGWMISVYINNCRYDSCWHDNPVDDCYEMILKLNKLNLL